MLSWREVSRQQTNQCWIVESAPDGSVNDGTFDGKPGGHQDHTALAMPRAWPQNLSFEPGRQSIHAKNLRFLKFNGISTLSQGVVSLSVRWFRGMIARQGCLQAGAPHRFSIGFPNSGIGFSKAGASRPTQASSLSSHVCPSFDASSVHLSFDMQRKCLKTQLQKSALHSTVEYWR